MKKSLNAILVLVVLAMLVSLYLVNFHYSDNKEEDGFCITGNNCALVDETDYSEIFGIPLSLYGFFTFVLVFVLAWCVKKEKKIKLDGKNIGKKGFSLLLLIVLIFSVLFAAYLFLLELFVIDAFCSFCLILDVLIILMLIFSVKIYKGVLKNGRVK